MTKDPVDDRRIVLCRMLIQIRKAVGDSLGFTLCPNPVWDMLLDLYVAHHEQRDLYLWPLCIAANTPLSTAHRKITEMEKKGLLVRTLHDRDRRRVRVRLTTQSMVTIAALLDRIDAVMARHVDGFAG